MNPRIIITLFIVLNSIYGNSQEKTEQQGFLTGSVELNANVFIKDSSINAFNIPQYETQFFGGESWVSLQYTKNGLTAGLRYDIFLNSNLRNPTDSYSDRGLGRWWIKKSFEKLEISVGYLYDQIGSGIIYRAYETRPLFIDNALLGAKIKYRLTDDWNISAFGGQQKNAFDIYGGSLQGLSSDYFVSLGETSPITLSPGAGFVHKNISNDAMDRIVNSLKGYLPVDRFGPIYSSYAFSLYNTLTYKNISWYAEAALKSNDIFYNDFALQTTPSGGLTNGKYVLDRGSVLYTSISYASKKLGLSFEGKRTENFNFRIDPNLRLLRGYISYIPPMNRQNTYRLTARYAPFTQEVSEQAFQVDVKYKWTKKLNTLINFSYINTLDGDKLYREFFSEVNYKPNSSLTMNGGLQVVNYNQNVYEQKPEAPIVKTFVPYFDILKKINRRNSLRVEGQYMHTQQDFGSWLNGLIEYGFVPGWLFEISGMFNIVPKRTLIGASKPEKILYPSLGAVYAKGPNRYQLRYVKQVEGVVCSGGICRLEPAFSGVRFSLSSQF